MASDTTGGDLNSSPPAPASDSSSSPPADSSTSSSPTPAADSSPPPAESPPQSPPPSIDPPPSSPPPTVESSPPPTVKSPPSSSSSPPSESQPSPTESSPPPSPPSNNSPSTPSSSVSPTTPANQTPVFIPPPRTSDKTPPGSIGRLSPPTSASNPGAPAPPWNSQGSLRPSSGSSSSSSSDSGSRDALIIGVVVGGIFILALVIVCLLCSKKKKKQPYYSDPRHPPKGGEQYWNGGRSNDHVVKLSTPPSNSWGPLPPGPNPSSSEFSSSYSGQQQPGYGPPSPNVGGMMGGYNQSQFTYEELAAATSGFAQTNLLGQGGFGYVHKGLLPNGKEVAVKSLKSGSGQGEREFQAEVEIISRVHHRHLVSLVGYCISGEQRMLVYEFVPNNTMEFHLHGKGQPGMEWQTRMLIALGSAKGLAYLHEDCNPRIIHRDIKSANILLDDNYEAMVADFGLAKLTTDNFTHISTRVMGTFGYMAPEYASSGKLTEKSDVFSYGIMLLELITGRRPIDLTNSNMEDGLVDWARPLIPEALEKDDFSELVDPRLDGDYDHHEMARMITCASACVRHSARRRPKMSQIIRALDGNSSLDDLNEVPKKSPSTVSSRVISETNAYDTGMYNADMMKFRKMVLNSEEYNPSEDGLTSEYGLNPSASSSDESVSKQQKTPY